MTHYHKGHIGSGIIKSESCIFCECREYYREVLSKRLICGWCGKLQALKNLVVK